MIEVSSNSDLVLPISSQDHIQGLATAMVTLVEYGSYQCPACTKAQVIVQNIQKQLGAKLCFVFRHFPRQDIYPCAQHASEAAEAAASQGSFWQMHDMLLAHPNDLDDGDLVCYASRIGLNVEQFLSEMTSDRHVERVQADYDSGVRSDVICTPTFFVNGVRHHGDWDETSLMVAILSNH
jgi:protein-disulfide isomerase